MLQLLLPLLLLRSQPLLLIMLACAAAAAAVTAGSSSNPAAQPFASPAVTANEPHVAEALQSLLPSEKAFRAEVVLTLTCASRACRQERTVVEPWYHISLDLFTSMTSRGIPVTSYPGLSGKYPVRCVPVA